MFGGCEFRVRPISSLPVHDRGPTTRRERRLLCRASNIPPTHFQCKLVLVVPQGKLGRKYREWICGRSMAPPTEAHPLYIKDVQEMEINHFLQAFGCSAVIEFHRTMSIWGYPYHYTWLLIDRRNPLPSTLGPTVEFNLRTSHQTPSHANNGYNAL